MAASKTKTSETPEAIEVAATPSPAPGVEQHPEDKPMDTPIVEVTLDEFMQKLSQRDARVELINAFAFTERQAGHVKATEPDFQASFVAFTQLPIEG